MVEALGSEIHQNPLPELIQGGMGVGISNWELARSVAVAGEKLDKRVLGVVSGTGLPILMVNRLQRRDPNAIMALEAFDPVIANEIFDEYLAPEGKKLNRYKIPPKPEVLVNGTDEMKGKMTKLAVASAFSEVWLAKQGHSGPIGINLLEKIQLMPLPTILGAMIAGVDTVLVGAGIPNQIPDILENFSKNQTATYRLDIQNSKEKYLLSLDPGEFIPEGTELKKPEFLAIISHHLLAMMLAKKEGVSGFVIEGPEAGGHNAPARSKEFDEKGQPVYGEKDKPNLGIIMEKGKPFWLAGSYAGKLREAQGLGAVGVQVGTAFALSEESGIENNAKRLMRKKIREGTLDVITSAVASPTGFPLQLVQLEGSLTDKEVYEGRKRVCSAGYLVEASQNKDGDIVFSCPAEPQAAFVRKGGDIEMTEGKMCICTGSVASSGHGQIGEERFFTLGKDLSPVADLLKEHPDGYRAEDVVGYVFSD